MYQTVTANTKLIYCNTAGWLSMVGNVLSMFRRYCLFELFMLCPNRSVRDTKVA